MPEVNSDWANAPRHANRVGYDVWFVTCAQPELRRGFWFRYTTLHTAGGESDACLWGFVFDGSPVAAKQVHPRATLSIESNPFRIRLGDARLGPDGCSGDTGVVSWDLCFEPEPAAPFPFVRPRWERLLATGNVAAYPLLRISGTVAAGGRHYQLDGAYGAQQHTWGATHALEWNWGYAGGDGFWVDGASSRVRTRLGREISGSPLGARLGEHDFRLNGLLQVLRQKATISASEWRAEGRVGRRRLEVSIRPRPEDLVGVVYADPAGGRRVCYHTEVADLELRLYEGERELGSVAREGGAAFEYASERELPGRAPAL